MNKGLTYLGVGLMAVTFATVTFAAEEKGHEKMDNGAAKIVADAPAPAADAATSTKMKAKGHKKAKAKKAEEKAEGKAEEKAAH